MYELTTDFTAVSAQLSGDWVSRRFTISYDVISVIMFGSTLGTLIVLAVLHIYRVLSPQSDDLFRWQLDNSYAVLPLTKR